jgi:protein phosphatase
MIRSRRNTVGSKPGVASDLAFKAYAHTSSGSQCDQNEDAWFIGKDTNLLVVADGMGGTYNARSASDVVCDSLSESLTRLSGNLVRSSLTSRIGDALWLANRELRRRRFAAAPNLRWRPASTLALAVRWDRQVFVKSVGDARGFLVRNGVASQLTADQTVDSMLARIGGGRRIGVRNFRQQTLLSFLGQHDFVPNDELRLVTMRAGDRLLLCTSSVTNALDAAQIADALSGGTSADDAATHLIRAATEHDPTDDATCIVLSAEEAVVD